MLYLALMALFNRARGSQLFDLVKSTTIGRLVSALAMTIATLFVTDKLANPVAWTVFPLLYLWMIPAWDKYWSAEIGHEPTYSKLWGFLRMTARQALILPAILVINPHILLSVLLVPFLSLSYVVTGIFFKNSNPIMPAELINGAIIGLMFTI